MPPSVIISKQIPLNCLSFVSQFTTSVKVQNRILPRLQIRTFAFLPKDRGLSYHITRPFTATKPGFNRMPLRSKITNNSLSFRNSSTMKEAIVDKGPKVRIVDSPIPKPEKGQVLIKVVVSGSNPKGARFKSPQWQQL
jgi:hypothetical protein